MLLQAECPEALEEFLEVLQPFRARAVEPPRPLTSLSHETGLLEYAQVLRDGRPGDVEARRDLAGRELATGEQPQDLSPLWLRECVEHLHGKLA